jgi:hypothetical protein
MHLSRLTTDLRKQRRHNITGAGTVFMAAGTVSAAAAQYCDYWTRADAGCQGVERSTYLPRRSGWAGTTSPMCRRPSPGALSSSVGLSVEGANSQKEWLASGVSERAVKYLASQRWLPASAWSARIRDINTPDRASEQGDREGRAQPLHSNGSGYDG